MSFVALILLTVLWFLFSGATRHYKNTDGKLKGVQGAQLFIEHLRNDLERVCWDDEHQLTGAGQGDKSTRNTVSFFVYKRDRPPRSLQPAPTIETVTYRFDKESGQVYRNGEPMRFGRFEKVAFRFVPGNTKDSFRAPNLPGRTRANTLMYLVSSASDETLENLQEAGETEEEEWDPEKGGVPRSRRGVTTLIGAINVKGKVAADQFPGWVDNGPDEPRVE